MFVFVVIGVPIWMLTTTTYRATLPFDEIDEISFDKNLEFSVNIELIQLNRQTSAKELSEFESKLLTKINKSNQMKQQIQVFEFYKF